MSEINTEKFPLVEPATVHWIIENKAIIESTKFHENPIKLSVLNK